MVKFEIINKTKKDLKKEIVLMRKVVKYTMKKEGISKAVLDIIIINNDEIQSLNKKYRNIDKPTDVISFALEDEKDNAFIDIRILGDIYISIDKALEQKNIYSHSLERELSFLTVHGLLHLLRYDHIKADDEKIMFAKQNEILNELKIYR